MRQHYVAEKKYRWDFFKNSDSGAKSHTSPPYIKVVDKTKPEKIYPEFLQLKRIKVWRYNKKRIR